MLSPEQKAARAAYNKIYRKDSNTKTPRIRKNVKESKTCWNCKQTIIEQTSSTWKDLEKQFKSLIPKWE